MKDLLMGGCALTSFCSMWGLFADGKTDKLLAELLVVEIEIRS